MRRTLLIALVTSAVLAPSAGAATVHPGRAVTSAAPVQAVADADARLMAAYPTDEIRWCKRLGRSEVECHLVFFYPHHETIIAADGIIIEAEVMWPGWRQIVVTPTALHQVAIEGFAVSG